MLAKLSWQQSATNNATCKINSYISNAFI